MKIRKKARAMRAFYWVQDLLFTAIACDEQKQSLNQTTTVPLTFKTIIPDLDYQ